MIVPTLKAWLALGLLVLGVTLPAPWCLIPLALLLAVLADPRPWPLRLPRRRRRGVR